MFQDVGRLSRLVACLAVILAPGRPLLAQDGPTGSPSPTTDQGSSSCSAEPTTLTAQAVIPGEIPVDTDRVLIVCGDGFEFGTTVLVDGAPAATEVRCSRVLTVEVRVFADGPHVLTVLRSGEQASVLFSAVVPADPAAHETAELVEVGTRVRAKLLELATMTGEGLNRLGFGRTKEADCLKTAFGVCATSLADAAVLSALSVSRSLTGDSPIDWTTHPHAAMASNISTGLTSLSIGLQRFIDAWSSHGQLMGSNAVEQLAVGGGVSEVTKELFVLGSSINVATLVVGASDLFDSRLSGAVQVSVTASSVSGKLDLAVSGESLLLGSGLTVGGVQTDTLTISGLSGQPLGVGTLDVTTGSLTLQVTGTVTSTVLQTLGVPPVLLQFSATGVTLRVDPGSRPDSYVLLLAGQAITPSTLPFGLGSQTVQISVAACIGPVLNNVDTNNFKTEPHRAGPLGTTCFSRSKGGSVSLEKGTGPGANPNLKSVALGKSKTGSTSGGGTRVGTGAGGFWVRIETHDGNVPDEGAGGTTAGGKVVKFWGHIKIIIVDTSQPVTFRFERVLTGETVTVGGTTKTLDIRDPAGNGVPGLHDGTYPGGNTRFKDSENDTNTVANSDQTGSSNIQNCNTYPGTGLHMSTGSTVVVTRSFKEFIYATPAGGGSEMPVGAVKWGSKTTYTVGADANSTTGKSESTGETFIPASDPAFANCQKALDNAKENQKNGSTTTKNPPGYR